MSRRAERGGALVEFAVIAPVMTMVFFGALEFGYILFSYHSVDYAARVGSRWASVRGATCHNTTVCPTSAPAVKTYVQSTVPGLGNASVTTQWISPPSTWSAQPILPNGNPATCDNTDQNQGCIVEVTVTNSLPFVVPFIRTGRIDLTSTSQTIIGQ